MKAPRFWWGRRPTLAARLLAGVGWVYGAVTVRRMARPGARCQVPVLCVGNFIAGGAGKTPTAIAVARALLEAGHRPVFLTRGYGGAHRGAPLTVDLLRHGAGDVGDEALLLARVAPTLVAADRVAAAAAAVALGASVVIMDDGMQNPALAKDFTLAVVDGTRGHGNGLCVPAGPLRAPVAAQAHHVQAILAIGLGPGMIEAAEIAKGAGKPVFRADLLVEDAVADRLAGQKVLAFAGIGHPEKFYETLSGLYARVVVARPFPDHHPFSDSEAEALCAEAREKKLTLVTTEKDAVRLRGTPALEALAGEAIALPVNLKLPRELTEALLSAAGRRPKRA